MRAIPKEKALELLAKTLANAPKTSSFARYFLQRERPLERWARDARVVTEAIFGRESEQFKEMSLRVKRVTRLGAVVPKSEECEGIMELLRSFSFEISELWSDEGVVKSVEYVQEAVKTEEEPVNTQSKNVFLVHGHDHGRMQAVARFLEHIGLNPVILHERASTGATIIEKLETHAEVAFAVVLLTPDDIGSIASDKQDLQPRARQNVVLELGYFLGRLGRRRTCALVVKGVEIPSDYSGVLYIPIDKGDGWKFHLARELKAAGLPVDLNQLA